MAILFESEHSSEKRKKTPLEVTLLRSESPRSGVPHGRRPNFRFATRRKRSPKRGGEKGKFEKIMLTGIVLANGGLNIALHDEQRNAESRCLASSSTLTKPFYCSSLREEKTEFIENFTAPISPAQLGSSYPRKKPSGMERTIHFVSFQLKE